jgi:arginyl-tRNA synthetase
VIPADLSAELARAVGAAIAAGHLPAGAARLRASGTWRPPPADSTFPAPGAPTAGYATSLPFELARLAGREPRAVAAGLARALQPAGWISSAAPTGAGYLTIEVTSAALASLAVRVSQAGPACARSDALAGVTRSGLPLPDLAAEPGWQQAWRDQAAALAGRLAAAAGATVIPGSPPELTGCSGSSARAQRPGVADAVAWAGADAIRYWLARMPAGRTGELGHGLRVTCDLADPGYLVSFAHADATCVLRWAADLGHRRGDPDGRLAQWLPQPAELALLTRLSWLAERVAGAARRRQPAELPRYLEGVAAAWLACRESCPALPFGGQAAPRGETGISARLWLADATRTALDAGLGLIGVAAPDRLPVNAAAASVVLCERRG